LPYTIQRASGMSMRQRGNMKKTWGERLITKMTRDTASKKKRVGSYTYGERRQTLKHGANGETSLVGIGSRFPVRSITGGIGNREMASFAETAR